MSPVWSFAFLWRFQSLAAGTPTKVQEQTRCTAFTADRAKRLLNFAHFILLPRVAIRPQVNESHIMFEDRCQKSLNSLGSNDHIRCQSGIVTGCRKSGRS